MKAEIRKELLNLWRNHRGASVGLATGTMIAVAMLIFGFWQTVFVLFMAAAGLWLGHEHDIGGDAWLDLKESLAHLLPVSFQRYRGKD